MRLIDADEYEGKVICNHLYSGVTKLIEVNSVPTAFDLESVVEKLNKNKKDAIKAIEENSPSEFHMIKIMDLKELFEEYTQEQIDIIKSAANATNGKNGG